MNHDDRIFLSELSKEMRNQDTFGTRKPIFWTVTDEVWVRDIEEGELYFRVDEEEYDAEDFMDYLANHADELGFDEEQLEDLYWDIHICENSPCQLAREWEECFKDVEIYGLRKERRIVKNTLFLTQKACRQHIEDNAHNYRNPLAFCWHAHRSPEVERLFELIENTDWQAVCEN